MATIRAITSAREAAPVYEELRACLHSVVSVGTTAVALPDTNLSHRKEVTIQNIHASNTLYIGSSLPEGLVYNGFQEIKKAGYDGMGNTFYKLRWQLSGSGTNEWYAVDSSTLGDPGITQPLRIYGITSAGGSEAALTAGTTGLSNLEWEWADNDTLGYSTVYFRHNSGNPETLGYLTMVSYTKMPDSSSNYGIKLGPNDSYSGTYGGSCRLFGIASAASTTTVVLESL